MREGDRGVEPSDELLIAVRPRAGVAEGMKASGKRVVVALEQRVDQAECDGLPGRGLRVEPRDPRHQGVDAGLVYGGRGHARIVADCCQVSVKYEHRTTQICSANCSVDSTARSSTPRASPGWRTRGLRPPPPRSSRRPSTVGRSRTPDGGWRTYGVLLGLDAALAHANPLLGGAAPPALAEYALRYAESGRFDSGSSSRRPAPPLRPPGPPRATTRRPGRRLRLGRAGRRSRLGRL